VRIVESKLGVVSSAVTPTSVNAGYSADYDDRKYAFTQSLHGVSAKEEKIPDLPIVTVAQNAVALDVLPRMLPHSSQKRS